MLSHCLLAFIASTEKSAVNITGVPFYVTCGFSLPDFKIVSLSLMFSIFTMMCLFVGLFAFNLLRGC